MNVYIRMAYRLWSNNGCLPTEGPVVVQFKRLNVSMCQNPTVLILVKEWTCQQEQAGKE